MNKELSFFRTLYTLYFLLFLVFVAAATTTGQKWLIYFNVFVCIFIGVKACQAWFWPKNYN